MENPSSAGTSLRRYPNSFRRKERQPKKEKFRDTSSTFQLLERPQPKILKKPPEEKASFQPSNGIHSRAPIRPTPSIIPVTSHQVSPSTSKVSRHFSGEKKYSGLDKSFAIDYPIRSQIDLQTHLRNACVELRQFRLKFLSQGGKIQHDIIHSNLCDSPVRPVIGVLGRQGVGKSTILSHFHAKSFNIFPHQFEGYHHQPETIGINLSISPERLILLDTQPVLSEKVIEKLYKKNLVPDNIIFEDWLLIQTLQMILLMLSICQVVLVVVDQPDDAEFFDLICQAYRLRSSIPDFLLKDPPELVFVHNRCSRKNFTPEYWLETCKNISTKFADSGLTVTGNIHSLNHFLPNPAFQTPFLSTSPVNLILLPKFSHSKEAAPSLQQMLESPDFLISSRQLPTFHDFRVTMDDLYFQIGKTRKHYDFQNSKRPSEFDW